MGVTVYNVASPYTLLMGVLWFSVFVLLSLVARKLRYPVKFSVTPLMALLILSLFRMFLPVGVPNRVIIESHVFFPVVVSFLQYEIVPYTIVGLSVNILNTIVFTWALVTALKLIKLARKMRKSYRKIIHMTLYDRDEEAESLLAKIVDCEKSVRRSRVYRVSQIKVPMAAGVKPYIFLPDIEFSSDELRAILKHEWKHINDKDYVVGIISNIIIALFWWNPLAYILRKNVSFAQELKSDYFAVTDDDYKSYLGGIDRLVLTVEPEDDTSELSSKLVNKIDEARDRGKSLALHKISRGKSLLVNLCFCVVAGALFLLSYAFIIQPVFWEVPGIVEVPYIVDLDYPSDSVFRPGETFIMDNGDGTFSLYLDGQHVMDVDSIDGDAFAFLPMRTRGDD